MASAPVVVLTTFSGLEDARRVVRELVDRHVIACGTIVPGATSIYRWEGSVAEEGEVVALLKTDASRWDDLVAAVNERHPYKLPELLALPVQRGLERYLSWVSSEVGV